MADPTPAAAAPANYTVLARRYRPQTFKELLGQDAVARALVNALLSNRVAHAYLLTGPRGVGKTTTARILAKALNCERGPTPEPCGACDACRAIAAGDDVDVLEIDGASNNKVDEIRELRSNAQYRPSRSRFKIYIIDEVHMLSTSAFNALLKTLEEPPPHVKFIFATTEARKIPVTVLSRCQRFDLGGIAAALIQQRLAEIVRGEGLQADDDALELVARRAGGSMRDAQSLLDQLLAFGGDRLTADEVHRLLGTAGDEHILALADAVLAQDPARALERLQAAAVDGFQLGELLDQLLAYWRDLMVSHVAGEAAADLSVPRSQRAALLRQARALNLDVILAGLDVLSGTRARLQRSGHARTLVEMALVRLCRLGDLIPLAQLTQWLGQARPEAAPKPAGDGGARPAPPEAGKKKPLPTPAAEGGGPVALTPETLTQVWSQILRSVGGMLASDLQKAETPAISGPNTLVLRFPARYNQAREHCQEQARLKKVEDALRKQTGQDWQVRVESGAAAGPAPAPAPTAEEAAAPPRPPRRSPKEDAEKEPLIKRAVDVLQAQVVRVDEGFAAAEPPRRPAATEEDS
jgi:DNA polymerase-3 subunit gamma/tau